MWLGALTHGLTCRLGAFPEALLDLSVERARECVARDASIQALESSCANAFALYKRTRPAASTESLKRARALPRPGPHPVLVALAERQRLGGAATEAAKADITQALKRFRPAATVLEAQVRTQLCAVYCVPARAWRAQQRASAASHEA